MGRIFLIKCILAFATIAAGPAAVMAQAPSSVSLSGLDGQPAFLQLKAKEEYLAIVFLSPECPLCQNYTAVLNKLSGVYKGKIAVYGIIPGKSYSAAVVKKFREDYHISFDLLFDRRFQLCRLLKATTTPQAFLISRKNEVVYSGLIDNWAVSLGVQRTVVTVHYLDDAIVASIQHLPVNPRSTKPVGCLINIY
jgi:peroxiredoxin